MGGYWEVPEQYVVLCFVGGYFRREHAYWPQRDTFPCELWPHTGFFAKTEVADLRVCPNITSSCPEFLVCWVWAWTGCYKANLSRLLDMSSPYNDES